MSYMFINTLYIYIYAYEKIFLRFKIVKKKKKKRKLALKILKGYRIIHISREWKIKNKL